MKVLREIPIKVLFGIIIALMVSLVLKKFFGLTIESINIYYIASILILLLSTTMVLDYKKKKERLYDNKKFNRKDIYFLGIIIVLGLFLRISNLGLPAFGDDEFATAYVSKIFSESLSFSFPSGIEYNRSYLDIILRGLSIFLFGFNEFSTRLPSVLFSIATIALIFIIGQIISERKVAILSAILITFLPWQITWAREARMYALSQLGYLLSIILVYIIIKKSDVKSKNNKRIVLIFLLLLPILSILIHEILILIIPIIVIYLLREYIENKKIKKVTILLIASSLVIVLSLIFRENLPFFIKEPFNFNLDFFYLAFLKDSYPLFFIMGSLGSFVLLFSKNKLKFLLGISFVVPFIIIELFLNWNSSKYIYFLFPSIVLASSYFIVWISKKIRENSKKVIIAHLLYPTLFISFILISIPFSESYKIHNKEIIGRDDFDKSYRSMPHSEWKLLAKELKKRDFSKKIMISTHQWGPYHYLDIKENLFWLRRESAIIENSVYNEGKFEIYTGAKVIRNYEEFLDIISESSGFIIVDNRFSRYYVSTEIINYVKKNMREEIAIGNLIVYSWE